MQSASSRTEAFYCHDHQGEVDCSLEQRNVEQYNGHVLSTVLAPIFLFSDPMKAESSRTRRSTRLLSRLF